MRERDEVVERWRTLSIMEGISWAFESATDRTLSDCSVAAGHSRASIGQTRFALFADRLDRAFTCGRYDLPVEGSEDAGSDLVLEELSDGDIATMPTVERTAVRRADLNGSPGWTCGRWRWLLASASVGELRQLSWSHRSATKQRVAAQPAPQDEPTLFDQSPDTRGWLAATPVAAGLDLPTLVVGYSHDLDRDALELGVGRPRPNDGGGPAWHWWHDLRSGGEGSRSTAPLPPGRPSAPDAEPDAPVRLRPAARRHGTGNAAGPR
jgi:hypothetical protein